MDNHRSPWVGAGGGYNKINNLDLSIPIADKFVKQLTADDVMAPWLDREMKEPHLYNFWLAIRTGLAFVSLGRALGAVK